MDKIKVLFLAANPGNTTRLKLDEEIRAITQKIRASEYRDSLDLISAWAVRPDDLLQYFNEHKPQIVHFSGHGNKRGEILLLDSNGMSKPMTIESIKLLFSSFKDDIQVVILNACYSQVQAEAITEIIGCSIGMNATIGDKAAIVFASSFYRAIGFGRSVREAFEQGKTALLLEGIPESDIPQLLTKKEINPSEIILINPPENWASNSLSFRKEPDEHHYLASREVVFSRLANPVVILSTFGSQWAVNECIPNFKLGNEYGIDFVVVTGQSFYYNVTLVYLASPTAKPFTASGEYTAELNRAVKHINDCLIWIDENTDYFLRSLSRAMTDHYGASQITSIYYGGLFINAKIVIGRRHYLSENDNRRRATIYNQTNKRIEITNYDRLFEAMEKRKGEG